MDKDMQEVLKKAEVLIEALPYIQKFNRKIIVVKYGGSAMSIGAPKNYTEPLLTSGAHCAGQSYEVVDGK